MLIIKGYGSNLNLIGQVELDASLMEGNKNLFTSVGAISSNLIKS
jgi:isoaspartyl peptidase/L-asparaginase-like protein (Ntn-hydrolase superfamily)